MDTPLADRPAPDLYRLIRGGRSVRRYGPDPVDEALNALGYPGGKTGP